MFPAEQCLQSAFQSLTVEAVAEDQEFVLIERQPLDKPRNIGSSLSSQASKNKCCLDDFQVNKKVNCDTINSDDGKADQCFSSIEWDKFTKSIVLSDEDSVLLDLWTAEDAADGDITFLVRSMLIAQQKNS
jgi:hypothetical protein